MAASDAVRMRITLDIDDDLLAASKELARQEDTTLGVVISRLLRQALMDRPESDESFRRTVPGFRPFAAKPGVVVTREVIDRLSEEDESEPEA